MNEKNTKTYRSFRLQVAPGSYGAFAALGSFMYFISDSWALILASWLWLAVMCYIDKAFLSLLYARKYRLATFCVLVLGILASPIVILASSNGALAEFFSIMIPPAGGILIAVYVYHVYSPDNIRRLGWVDLDGKY